MVPQKAVDEQVIAQLEMQLQVFASLLHPTAQPRMERCAYFRKQSSDKSRAHHNYMRRVNTGFRSCYRVTRWCLLRCQSLRDVYCSPMRSLVRSHRCWSRYSAPLPSDPDITNYRQVLCLLSAHLYSAWKGHIEASELETDPLKSKELLTLFDSLQFLAHRLRVTPSLARQATGLFIKAFNHPMHGSSSVHKSPTLSPSASSSSSSSTSSLSRSSLSPSLSPAHSIQSKKAHHSKHQRRPSPLKRQMSLGTGAPSSPAQTAAPFDINPLRSHAAGPLAVLYSVEPDEDPLINPHQSPTRSPSKISPSRGNLHSSPFNYLTATSGVEAPGTPRPVSALAALDRAAPAASPNRSLLSAFQAVSPRLQNITARSSSAPSLSNLNNGSARAASPRGPVPHQQSALAPASPISTSPRQTTHRTSYATAAFRALNGASPQKQVPSRSSSSSSSVASTSAAINVSPVRSRSSSALRQVQNDGPSELVPV